MLSITSPAALAHGGQWHLDDETLESIFHFMDRIYHAFIAHLPLMAGIVAGVLILLAVIKVIRTRSG
ncbi:hypothetical protein [Methylohalobius crimeensis]|uniref:hypothetical protein n=1 Tax=Methylohalobius crimeensis TaxID=244365 RepID=UPI0012693459|nr:hypothetical protein [Methylohalobius crimeensis]